MSTDFVLEAKAREDQGKGASRRLRRLEQAMPAIIYGAGKDPAPITLRHDDVFHASENEAFFSSIIEIKVDGNTENVIIKDLQRHPAKQILMHADFLRVRMDEEIHVKVPLHFINEEACVGVKMEGGQIARLLNELDVACLPGNLPEYIEVDLLDLHLGDSLHISDLTLPENVTSVDLAHGEASDHAIAQITAIKTVEEPEEAPAAEAEGEEAADSDDGDEGGEDSSE